MEKAIKDMSPKDKQALAKVLQWRFKPLYDCTKGELVDCVLHLTEQVALSKDLIDKSKSIIVFNVSLFGFIFKIERARPKIRASVKPAEGIMQSKGE